MGTALNFPMDRVGRSTNRTSRPVVTRRDVRQRAVQFGAEMRKQIELMRTSCTPRPQPVALFAELASGKTTTEESTFAALLAASHDVNMPETSINRFINWLHVQLISARKQRPLQTHATLWLHDTEAEGVANVGEHLFERAVMRGDVVEVERIIEQKTQQISAAYQLLVHMVATRDDMRGQAS